MNSAALLSSAHVNLLLKDSRPVDSSHLGLALPARATPGLRSSGSRRRSAVLHYPLLFLLRQVLRAEKCQKCPAPSVKNFENILLRQIPWAPKCREKW